MTFSYRWRQAICLAGFILCASAGAAPFNRAAPAGSESLKVDVIRDRLTLEVTRYPQVYLHGGIDAGAPQRFQALMNSGRVPAGSDIYLNASGGDIKAGMALGRMFRAGGMATHLGTPRQPKHASAAAKTAICVDACAYAYFGGLYRWAPSGSDRIGLTTLPTAEAKDSPDVAVYMKAMGIARGALASATMSSGGGRPVWMTADRMTSAGVANNGQLSPTATYNLSASAPTLEVRQVDRKGTHRLVIQCQPGKTTVTAYDDVGRERARQVAARGKPSYFQLDNRKLLDQASGGVAVDENALMIRRDYPPGDLVDLISAWSFGAWAGGRSDAFRDGFTMSLHPVHKQLKVFYYACWRAAPWPARRKNPG
ncbi:MAG: hypothetical protein M3Y93_00555 [Pseudomonadota bacterium]|nr:hypothetical protein [Pseudomonadota bacterium]